MIITITAPAGGNKTKTALEIGAALGLNSNQKVIYLTNDRDYTGWIPHIETFAGKDNMTNFRPMYVNDLEGAIHILPYIDHLPYDVIILDGFGTELAKLSQIEFTSLIHNMELYTTNKCGKVIVTLQGNNLDY
jgi:hypothetical protein